MLCGRRRQDEDEAAALCQKGLSGVFDVRIVYGGDYWAAGVCAVEDYGKEVYVREVLYEGVFDCCI